MPKTERLLRFRGPKSKLLKSTLTQNILYAGKLNLSPDISAQIILKMCAATKNCEKNH